MSLSRASRSWSMRSQRQRDHEAVARSHAAVLFLSQLDKLLNSLSRQQHERWLTRWDRLKVARGLAR